MRFSINRSILTVLAIAGILVLAVLAIKRTGGGLWKQRVETLTYNSNTRQVNLVHESRDVLTPPMFVGAGAISPRYAALVDYAHLYCLELSSGSLKPAAPILGSRRPPVWVPTGLAYDDVNDRLFVANYLGNQVYEGVLDCDGGAFTIRASIASRDTISPENVALSDNGDVLAVANYDGHNIAAFRRARSGDWKPLWTFALRFAHGVAILGDQVFATGLERRELVRIDLTSGEETRRIGSKGWNPWDHQMLYPTSLVAHRGHLFWSDAHTGLICSLDPQTLDAQQCFGGNGPLPEHLNMPYGIASLGNDLLVTSTFQGRVLLVGLDTREGATILTDYVANINGWKAIDSLKIPNREPHHAWFPSYRRDWSTDGYLQECELAPPLEGFRCGYGELRIRKRRVRLPLMDGLLNQCGYYYFVESFRGKLGTILFSPQNACLIYLSREQSGEVGLLPYRVRQGGWRVDDYLISGSQALSLLEVEAELRTLLANVQTKRSHGGVLLPEDAATIFFPGLQDRAVRNTAFERRLKATLASPEGQSFIKIYLACTPDACATTDLHLLARSLSNNEGPGVTVESRYLPCFLSGARCLR